MSPSLRDKYLDNKVPFDSRNALPLATLERKRADTDYDGWPVVVDDLLAAVPTRLMPPCDSANAALTGLLPKRFHDRACLETADGRA